MLRTRRYSGILRVGAIAVALLICLTVLHPFGSALASVAVGRVTVLNTWIVSGSGGVSLSPNAPGNHSWSGPTSIVNETWLNLSGHSKWAFAAVWLTLNGSHAFFVGYIENSTNYQVLISQGVYPGASGTYTSMVSAFFIVPKGSSLPINYGDFFVANYSTTLAGQLSTLGAGFRAAAGSYANNPNSNIRKWGGEEGVVGGALSNLSARIPGNISSLTVVSSGATVHSYSPSNPPQEPIGINPGDSLFNALYCILYVVTLAAAGFAIIMGGLACETVIGCILAFLLMIIVGWLWNEITNYCGL